METKIIEIRDEGTRIIALGLKFRGLNEWEKDALFCAGYGATDDDREWYVVLMPLNGGVETARCDPYGWPGRTMHEAHKWLRDERGAWDSLPFSGAVLDVQYLLGETDAPKTSELRR
jgi:hypothetical protein